MAIFIVIEDDFKKREVIGVFTNPTKAQECINKEKKIINYGAQFEIETWIIVNGEYTFKGAS